jgi:hypothetical protein
MAIRSAAFLAVRPNRLEPLGYSGVERLGTMVRVDWVDEVLEERGVWPLGRLRLGLL